MMKQVTELPKPMSRYRAGIPQDLDAIIMRLLEKDPADRFATGTELIAALDGAPVEPARKKSRMDTLGTFSMPPMRPMFKPVPMMNPNWMIPGGRMLERQKRHEERMQRREAKENARPLPDRIRSFRRHLASYVGTTTFLFGINAVTSPDFWWAIFPAMGMMMGLMNEGGGLWAAGARLSDVFGSSKPLAATGANAPLPAAAATSPGPGEITAEVLAGPRGSVARQAGADRRAIRDLVSRMSKSERDMLPDVEQTAENLYERIAELGRALHRLDAEMDPKKLPELDERISQTEKAEGTEADRRLRLLKRQREMMASLLESRDKLSEQYESAGLLLQNLKLDLIRMRSSGLQSGLAEVTSATQEARALSREIGYVLAAADELKDIDRDR
jgi:serine/threonine-protein kinase